MVNNSPYFTSDRPFATGNRLWRNDITKGDYHMDGAFSLTTHPRCRMKIGLPIRADVFFHILSPSLGRSKALEFYTLGTYN